MVAVVCQAFTRINPKETMKLFMPHLCDTVESLLRETDNVLNEENLNDELLYNLLLLSQVNIILFGHRIRNDTVKYTSNFGVRTKV